jgi:predicted permease
VLAWYPAVVAVEGEEKRQTTQFVTGNYFSELGAVPKLGRMIDSAQDEAAGAEPVVVVSEGFWERHYGSDPVIAGKTIRVNGKPATVIGVAPEEFSGLSLNATDLWIPVTQQPYFIDGSHMLTDFSVAAGGEEVWGRLRPGMTPKAAEDELRTLAAELRTQHPKDIWENETLPSEPGGYATGAMSGSQSGTGTKEPDKMIPIVAMMGALVLLILIVACGNLGSLLLARGVARQREIAIRVAVGAGSGRLVRQLFTESVLLGLLGSGAGLGLGYVVLRYMMAMTSTPLWLKPAPDWRVMAFAVGVGFAAAILFGLSPALQLARQRQRATFMRQILLGGQVAASCVLLIVAALLVRALNHAMSANPGFEYKQVISIDPGLGGHGYSAEKAGAYLDALKGRLEAVPGVESVAMASSAPLGNRNVVLGMDFEGRPLGIHINNIDPHFFETMKIPMVRGRSFAHGDTQAIIVSHSLAVVAWPGKDPIGQQIDMLDAKFTVVGVAGSARTTALQDPDAMEGYFLAGPSDMPLLNVLVKTSGAPEGVLPTVASIARSIDPKIFPEVQMMKSAFNKRMQAAEYSALTVGVLGFTALLLACLGIVGLVTYAVSQRTQEIGIRLALGARPSHVLGIVLLQFSRPVVVGLVVGVGGAAALSQILRRNLYGISHLDPVAYAAAVGIFIVVATLGALLPARRALQVDPLRALRYE